MIYPEDHPCMYASPDPNFLNDLTKAINDEYTAIACYTQLINRTSSHETCEQITEIRADEIRHLEEFSQIYASLTHLQPTCQMSEECPRNYCQGLHAAFIDEQKTVDFYQEIASRSPDPSIRETFIRAAADEQNHAVWFLYFYFKKSRH